MTISPASFSNVVAYAQDFQAHAGGFVYTFDKSLRVLSTAHGAIFDSYFLREPVVTPSAVYATGLNCRREFCMFELLRDQSREICGLPPGAQICGHNGDVLVFSSQKVFILSGNALMFTKALQISGVLGAFESNNKVYVLSGDELCELDGDFTATRQVKFKASRGFCVGNLLFADDFRASVDLYTMQAARVDLHGASVYSYLLYSEQRVRQLSRIDAFGVASAELGPQCAQRELFARVNELVAQSQRTAGQGHLRFSAAFYQFNPAASGDERAAQDVNTCAVPFELRVGQVADIQSEFSYKFKVGERIYGMSGRQLIRIDHSAVIYEVFEQNAADYIAAGQQIYQVSAGAITTLKGQLFAQMPGTAERPVFAKTFCLHENVFLLAQLDQVVIMTPSGGRFEQFQVLQEIFDFSNCFSFNKQLFIVGRDEQLADMLYIYQIRNGKFVKSDDMLLEAVGELCHFNGVLLDLYQNKLVDLDSRVIYKRRGAIAGFARKQMYPFGVCLDQGFLAEFEGFPLEFWKLRMQNIDRRETARV